MTSKVLELELPALRTVPRSSEDTKTMPSPCNTALILRSYFILLYLATFSMIAQFWSLSGVDSGLAWLFTVAASAGYAALYILPAIVLTALPARLLPVRINANRWRHRLLCGLALLTGSLTLLAIYADYRLFELYQYHFNGFVWNLLTTPGGIAALGATEATEQTIALHVALFFLGNGLALTILHHPTLRRWAPSRSRVVYALLILLTTLAFTEIFYAYSTHTGQEDYLEAADVIPFHLHSRATSAFKVLGIPHTAQKQLRLAGGHVNYPGDALAAAPGGKRPNILMLVGESFRWDLLSPEITPNLWKFSERSLRFENHYSGGNRTRMGLFSMFYGLYAPYWYSFEKQRVTPALMNFIRQNDYQLALHTSQSFDYPELRHTVFSGVPEIFMQELKTGDPWRRDIQNIDDLMSKLDRRDQKKPFYGFMFFESTHAPYSFPEAHPLRADYVREMNYVKLNLKENIDGIHARYINAAHHIDAQFGRLLKHLEKQGMLDNTVILFSGDHGEEFMEKGHWGHGHGNTFPEEQIRVPLVLWMPGQKPQVITHRTSHLQIAPTLLEYLGVTEPSRNYSSADSLFKPMDRFVVGEYDHMGIIDDQYKISFPFTGSDFFRYTVLDAQDRPVNRQLKQQVLAERRDAIDEIVRESARFLH